MKKILLLACLAAAFVFASCKTTEQDTTKNGLVDGNVTVEDDSTGTKTGTGSTGAEDAETDYSDIIGKTDDARKKALDAGAKEYYADAFAATDLAYNALKSLNDGNDHALAFAELKARYDAFEKAAKAKKLKERIDEDDLAKHDQADYNRGEKALKEFEELMPVVTTPGKTLSAKAGEAYDAYYDVYFKTFKKFANEERKEALSQKKRADAVKAQVSRKDEYKKYADLITKGDSQYSTQNPEEAYKTYQEANAAFKELADDVEEKRAAAQKAIDEAKEKVKAVENYALRADAVNPLEEKIDGIEDEGAVLLEEDDFVKPEEQIIEIDENLEGDAK